METQDFQKKKQRVDELSTMLESGDIVALLKYLIEIEDKIDEMEEKTSPDLRDYLDQIKGKDGKDGHTPIKGIDYMDGVDGRNPLFVGNNAPLNPKIGDLWYKP